MPIVRILEKLDPTYDYHKLSTIADIIIDDIVKTLSIRKGTYIFDPEVGSNLSEFVFEQNDEETYRAVYSEVESVITSRTDVSLDDLKLSITQDRKGIIIDIFITILETQEQRQIKLLATNEYISLIGE